MKRGEGDPWKEEEEEERRSRSARAYARAHTSPTRQHTKRDKEYQVAERCTRNRAQITARGANRREKKWRLGFVQWQAASGTEAGTEGGGGEADDDEEERKKAASRRTVRRSEGAGETDVGMAD